MPEDTLQHDDQSHYEISLTAGQAFLAFVLMLLSLAASFAFGLMIGKGPGDSDRLIVRKEPAVITEASAIPKKNAGQIVELGVNGDDFKPATTTSTAPVTDSSAPPASTITEATTAPAPMVVESPKPVAETPKPVASNQPAYAQLLSSSDQKTAETLAAKLIGSGFTGAYVDRTTPGIFKVRVKFASEADARAAEPKLREFAKDMFIVK
ncbi:MAG TPA: SPOR domain-containing protein [Thermoanaerobaculia bacterium]